ncbi:MAG: HupE/UreJ family protein [Cyanobacteria bacterium P01_F01_bin.33]
MTTSFTRALDRAAAIALGTVGTLAVGFAGFVLPARAHHPTGGDLPATFLQGLLSGLGHPVIGLDHLAFALALGVLAAFCHKGMGTIAAFLGTSLLGTVLHLHAIDLPGVEMAIAGSTLMFGLLVLFRRARTPVIAVIAAVAGLFHGYAYGESIIGAEPTPLVAYLIGFTAIQAALSLGAMKYALALGERRVDETAKFPMTVAIGGVIVGIGFTFFAQSLGI